MATVHDSNSIESVRKHVAACLAKIDAYGDPAVWISRAGRAQIDDQIARIADRFASGVAQPLIGLTFAVKDNIDVLGLPTTAGCPGFAYEPTKSAFVVQRLCDAGAIVMGKTNLDQFATGLVGTRSPYGACRNTFNPECISGGSSSGSAVAVAAGLVDFSLGTDTAGSGRVPAALNQLIGVKPTCGLLSSSGMVPACRSLDCVSIFTKTCDLAARVLTVAKGFDASDVYSRSFDVMTDAPMPQQFRFGVPDSKDLEFFGNADMAKLFVNAIARAKSLGGTRVTFDLKPFLDTAELLYDGPWVAERLAAVGPFYREKPDAVHPVIAAILNGAGKYSAVDAFNGAYKLKALRRQTETVWGEFDVMLLPTTGTAYTIAELLADPMTLNRNLGYYTNFVNLLDLSALALPAGMMSNGVPGGITFIAPAGHDDRLLQLGKRFETTEIPQ